MRICFGIDLSMAAGICVGKGINAEEKGNVLKTVQ